MSRLPHRLAIAALVGMLVPVNAFADYRESFSQGIRAYRAENWRATAVLMQQALQEQPRETGRVQITGNETVPYLPSFYLGDALLRQGDCAGALTAFERARNTPAANNRNWLARMDQARETCGGRTPAPPARPPDAAPAIAQAAQAVGEATTVRDRLNKVKEREFGAEAIAAASADISAAAANLNGAETRLGRARQTNDIQEAKEAESLATTAVGQFKEAEVRVEENVRRLTDTAAKAKEAAKPKPGSPPPPVTVPTPAPPTAPPAPDPREAEKQQRLQNAARTASTALRQAQQVATSYEASSGGGQRSKALQDATAELNSVAEIVRRGTRASEQELTSAAGSANRIRSLFERERDAALSRDLGESARAAETLLTSAGTSLKTLRDLAQSRGGRPAALDPAVLTPHERELASLRERIGGTSARDRDVLRRTVASARALDERLAEMVRTYGQQAAADSGVPPDLLQGAQAFFSGRYQDAVTQLEALRLPSGASSGVRLQAQLLRAAALFSTWALDREQDDRRRQAAVAAVAECRRLAPQFKPDATVFSPRFVRFYQSVK